MNDHEPTTRPEPTTRLILVCAKCGKEVLHNHYCVACANCDEYAPLSRRIEKLSRRVVKLERKVEERGKK